MVFKKRRERGGMQQVRQEQLLSPKGESMEEQIDLLLRERFARLHERQKMQVVRVALGNLFGRHHPVAYRPSYRFRERWQEARAANEEQPGYSFLRSQNYLLNIIYLTVFALLALTLWFLSVYRLFALGPHARPLLLLALLTAVADVVMKLLQWVIGEGGGKAEVGGYLRRCWKDWLLLGYLLVLLVEEFVWAEKTLWLLPVDAGFLLAGFQRFEELFAAIKIAILSSRYRNELQIVQLVCGCLLKVHLFSLLLFAASRLNPEENWTLPLGRFSESWGSEYVYSLYFTCTTMFTVGYGDITPKNLLEIAAIMLIQVIGVINLGYIINEIGRFLSKINEGQEVLYRDISAAEKVTATYKLPRELAGRMRNYLINHSFDGQEVTLQEEEGFLRKLNDDIRTDIDSYHKLETIKTSIFFICHWSKKFKQKVAQDLIKVLYPPQETLLQPHGHEKLFILVSGRLEVGIGPGSGPVKCLRVLAIDGKREVQDNVYGYSSLVSGFKVRLQAVAREYCIVYTIERGQLQAAAAENERDFEYYHLIRARIEGSKTREEWEAPEVRNTREHYSPNPYYVLKKDRLETRKLKRRFVFRQAKKVSFIIQSELLSTENEMSASEDEARPKRSKTARDLTRAEHRVRVDAMGPMKVLISTRDQRHRLKRKEEPLSEEEKARREKAAVLNVFEQGRRFQEFFPKWNQAQAIARCNRRAGWQENLDVAVEKEKLLIHEQITEEVAQKLLNIKTIASSHHE